MTERQMRVAIAQWMGYVVSEGGNFDGRYVAQGATVMEMPDYVNDLNAMHSAEKKLDNFEPWDKGWPIYMRELEQIGHGILIHATARQRCEALLRTLERVKASELIKAARDADWMQVVLNQGPPCFHLEDGRFCLRAERWDGHKTIGGSGPIHEFVSLESLLRSIASKK